MRAALATALATTLCVALARPAGAQDLTAFAQARYQRGVELFRAGDHAAALAEFRASLELYNSPNTRLYVARALVAGGRPDEAMAEFERAAREAAERESSDPRYGPTRLTAEAERREVASTVGRVVVTASRAPPAGARLRLGERAWPGAVLGLPVYVRPGHVEAALEDARGGALERGAVEVAAGQQVTLALRAVAAPGPIASRASVPPPPPRDDAALARALGATAVALGGGALVAFAVLAPLNAAAYSAARELCGGGAAPPPCLPPEDPRLARGEALQAGANATLAGGLALAVVGAVVLVAVAARRGAPVRAAIVGAHGAVFGATF